MSDWRDNPSLVDCFNNFRIEMEAMKGVIELEALQWSEKYNSNDKKHKTMVSLGANYRIRRERLQLTKTYLAAMSGVSRVTIMYMERNGGTPFTRGKIDKVLDELESQQMAAD